MLNRLTSSFDRKVSISSPSSPSQSPSQLTALNPKDQDTLTSLGIPLCSHAQACIDCSLPCDDDDDDPPEYLNKSLLRLWSKQEIDFTPSPLLSIAHPTPFRSHALISTDGKKDWVREVSEEVGSLAEMFEKFSGEDEKKLDGGKGESSTTTTKTEGNLPKGVWSTTQESGPTRVLYQNSSHYSSSCQTTNEEGKPNHTLLLFPSFQLLTNVPAPSKDNEDVLRAIWDHFLRRDGGGGGVDEGIAKMRRKELVERQGVKRWVLPYRAVVLLCSHKKRDARCSIAASLLSSALRSHAEQAGWTVDERGDDHDSTTSTWGSLSSSPSKDEGWEWRKMASEGKSPDHHGEDGEEGGGTLGIFQISHIGGHKYSGNVIIYFPTGAGVWYGRVSPVRDAKAVFEKTIQQGIIIPEFLRAGINLVRESPATASSQAAAAEGPSSNGSGGKATSTLVSGTRDELLQKGKTQDGGGDGVPRRSLVQW
ncbi:hypothetical protein CF326_g1867 [Tilletia indica]|nr:hypothetical protein CF326_g1867 [Tilletia indica]